MKIIRTKEFANGKVYALETKDGYPIETTDTFLPYYTKNAIGIHCNFLQDSNLGSREDRWIIGASCMSGCPVGCKFCATGQLNKWRNLDAEEICEQVMFIARQNKSYKPNKSKEFKINYTRMGEPFLNIGAVKKAINLISSVLPSTHHYVSTIGIKGSDFTWVEGNITLQISLHSTDVERRNDLIPYRNKMSLEELGSIRTNSNQKTTVNMTLIDENDFDISILKKHFDQEHFFIKLSPINTNVQSEKFQIGSGIIESVNLI